MLFGICRLSARLPGVHFVASSDIWPEIREYERALVAVLNAQITPLMDGYLARKQGLVSTLGRNLDPLVDKVLVCGAYIFLLPIQGAGLTAWMVTVVVARELIGSGEAPRESRSTASR